MLLPIRSKLSHEHQRTKYSVLLSPSPETSRFAIALMGIFPLPGFPKLEVFMV
jgi:hypothetical protein